MPESSFLVPKLFLNSDLFLIFLNENFPLIFLIENETKKSHKRKIESKFAKCSLIFSFLVIAL